MSYDDKDYASDKKLYEKYSNYQQRYKSQIRESDNVLIEMIREFAEGSSDKRLNVLDIGCSTGNFLLHLKKRCANLNLTGGDLMESAVRECQKNEELDEVEFRVMDIENMIDSNKYDVVIANVVLYLFDNEKLDRILKGIQKSLKPNGCLMAFDFAHDFNQSLKIMETSRSHARGLTFYFRSYNEWKMNLEKNKFVNIEFRPFDIQIDLPRDVTHGKNQDGFEDLNTYTIKSEEANRMLFRGTLFQPWCHLVAKCDR